MNYSNEKIIEEKLVNLSQAMMIWFFYKDKCTLPEKSFITQVLQKKLEVFEIGITIPDILCDMIGVCTNGNPGLSQIVLKEILTNIPDLEKGHEVDVSDFMNAYPDKFPIIEYDEVKNHLVEEWDKQKDDGINRVDTQEYWLEIFKK